MEEYELRRIVEEAKAKREYAGRLLTRAISKANLTINELAERFSPVWGLEFASAKSVIRKYQEGTPSSSCPRFRSFRAPNAPIYNANDIRRLGALFRYVNL